PRLPRRLRRLLHRAVHQLPDSRHAAGQAGRRALRAARRGAALPPLRPPRPPGLLQRTRAVRRDVRRDARTNTGLADRTRNPDPTAMIIYLHGFRSGPASGKAQALKHRMETRGLGHAFWCEQLPHEPARAIALIERALVEAPARNPGHAPT